jgi:hypothetical protein
MKVLAALFVGIGIGHMGNNPYWIISMSIGLMLMILNTYLEYNQEEVTK